MKMNCAHSDESDFLTMAAADLVCASRTSQVAENAIALAETTVGWSATSDRRTLGKFELLEQIGQGAFGVVFKARDRELGRIVAIKMPRVGVTITDTATERMLREARSLAHLQHHSIVPLYEIGRVDGIPYLVSEYVCGITLADLLTGERISYTTAAGLVASTAEALQHAHQQGIVHRDVKPSNIMLERISQSTDNHPYCPRLMDFGLAKFDSSDSTLTIDGQVLGTPAYMSPEQANGQARRVDGRSDIYSLGVILYQMLCGQLPFRGNVQLVVHQLIYDSPPTPRNRNPSVPRDLEAICSVAMAKDPKMRYQSAGDMAADLRRFLANERVHACPPKSGVAMYCVHRQQALLAAMVCIFLLLAVCIWA